MVHPSNNPRYIFYIYYPIELPLIGKAYQWYKTFYETNACTTAFNLIYVFANKFSNKRYDSKRGTVFLSFPQLSANAILDSWLYHAIIKKAYIHRWIVLALARLFNASNHED